MLFLIVLLVMGLAIGALARLLIPGKQSLTVLLILGVEKLRARQSGPSSRH